jgi:hypothetical protein
MNITEIHYVGVPTFYAPMPPFYKEIQFILVFLMFAGFMYFYYLSRKYPYVEVFEEFPNASRWNLPEVEL